MKPEKFASVIWQDKRLYLLDQTKLPLEESYIEIDSLEAAAEAIRSLKVRGAPAIGIAAAFALYVYAQNAADLTEFMEKIEFGAGVLAATRPTAVNLFWALDRMKKCAYREAAFPNSHVLSVKSFLLNEAQAIMSEDLQICRAIGEFGLELLKDGMTVMTYCNAGSLAASDYGTALAPIYAGMERGICISVVACETRPLLQGARLTAWELQKRGADVTLICDNMAAHIMSTVKIDAVITGCDRVAANGDTANKIGTYGLALLARAHKIPFYIAAPSSTIDRDTPDGNRIIIEERDSSEITEYLGRRIAPEGVKTYNPAFDVTPAELITAFITDKGIIKPPYGF